MKGDVTGQIVMNRYHSQTYSMQETWATKMCQHSVRNGLVGWMEILPVDSRRLDESIDLDSILTLKLACFLIRFS